jgi:hypothetical protein
MGQKFSNPRILLSCPTHATRIILLIIYPLAY